MVCPTPPLKLKPRLESMDYNLSEEFARECFRKNKNSAISFILSSSYLYYFYNRSYLSDEVFDKMCKWCYDNWEMLEHPHKYLFTRDDMRNGSVFHLKRGDYPTVVKISAEQWLFNQGEN